MVARWLNLHKMRLMFALHIWRQSIFVKPSRLPFGLKIGFYILKPQWLRFWTETFYGINFNSRSALISVNLRRIMINYTAWEPVTFNLPIRDSPPFYYDWVLLVSFNSNIFHTDTHAVFLWSFTQYCDNRIDQATGFYYVLIVKWRTRDVLIQKISRACSHNKSDVFLAISSSSLTLIDRRQVRRRPLN